MNWWSYSNKYDQIAKVAVLVAMRDRGASTWPITRLGCGACCPDLSILTGNRTGPRHHDGSPNKTWTGHLGERSAHRLWSSPVDDRTRTTAQPSVASTMFQPRVHVL